ncbi:Fc.00g104250.m01.CDS01 [Cosmosporella sp. VM-42]
MINNIPITVHDAPYAAISPLRPEVSQVGKTVLVCGGSTGIGHAIARSFCEAGASKVILLGRREEVLKDAASHLGKLHSNTEVLDRVCDVHKLAEAEALWNSFEEPETLVKVDVLVLNAVHEPAFQPILDQGTHRLWEDFEANYCLSVSTQDIHRWDSAPQMPGYQLTKSSFACVMQQIARDTPREKLQILNFHPSIVFTEAAAKAGYTRETLPWTDESIPGRFAVWAASPEAKFLHGRFVWATWDVDELASGKIRAEIDNDPWLLKVGVKGL